MHQCVGDLRLIAGSVNSVMQSARALRLSVGWCNLRLFYSCVCAIFWFWAFNLMPSCQWSGTLTRRRLCVITTTDPSTCWHWSYSFAAAGIHHIPAWLLQPTASGSTRNHDPTTKICVEKECTTYLRSQTFRPHHAKP